MKEMFIVLRLKSGEYMEPESACEVISSLLVEAAEKGNLRDLVPVSVKHFPIPPTIKERFSEVFNA